MGRRKTPEREASGTDLRGVKNQNNTCICSLLSALHVCISGCVRTHIVGVFCSVAARGHNLLFWSTLSLHHPTYTVSSLRETLHLIHLFSPYLMRCLECTNYSLKKLTLSNVPFAGKGKVVQHLLLPDAPGGSVPVWRHPALDGYGSSRRANCDTGQVQLVFLCLRFLRVTWD